MYWVFAFVTTNVTVVFGRLPLAMSATAVGWFSECSCGGTRSLLVSCERQGQWLPSTVHTDLCYCVVCSSLDVGFLSSEFRKTIQSYHSRCPGVVGMHYSMWQHRWVSCECHVTIMCVSWEYHVSIMWVLWVHVQQVTRCGDAATQVRIVC